MTTHEIRFRGQFIDLATESDALAFVGARIIGADKPSEWSVAPRKRWQLERAGFVLDTFDSEAEALAARDRTPASRLPPGFAPPPLDVVDTEAPASR